MFKSNLFDRVRLLHFEANISNKLHCIVSKYKKYCTNSHVISSSNDCCILCPLIGRRDLCTVASGLQGQSSSPHRLPIVDCTFSQKSMWGKPCSCCQWKI